MEGPVKHSRLSTRNDSPGTDQEKINVALRVFQQSAADLQTAVEKAEHTTGLKIRTAYLPSSKGVAVALIGFYYCDHCHWYSIGDHCLHCDSGRAEVSVESLDKQKV
jgi:hypothetical protein